MTARSVLPFRHYPIVWDLAIAALAFVGIGGIVLGYWFADFFMSLVFILALVLLLYGSFLEPKRIFVNKKMIQVKGLPLITIAIASDFHIGPYKHKRFLTRVVRRINALRPDLIVLPGDFLFDSDASVDALAPLKNLTAPLGVFAVLGNHDSGQYMIQSTHYQTADRSIDVTRILKECDITVLRNDSVRLTHTGIPFAIAGIDDLWMPTSDLPRTLLKISDCLPIILLSHNPDVILDPAHARASLIVSGHTHGGQIRVPGMGTVAPIPSETGRIYDQGIFTLPSGTTLALTHGIGETMCRARLFCPPEILLLSVTPSI